MRIVAMILFLVAGVPATSLATSIHFVQDGWESGGPLFVSFAGQDSNLDGALDAVELSEFSAIWRTPLGFDATWSLENIQTDAFFFFSLDDYALFAQSEEYSVVSLSFAGEAVSSVFDRFLFPVASSTAAPSPVPEPATPAMLALGMAALLFDRIMIGARRRGG